jgi:hypothetical protein
MQASGNIEWSWGLLIIKDFGAPEHNEELGTFIQANNKLSLSYVKYVTENTDAIVNFIIRPN